MNGVDGFQRHETNNVDDTKIKIYKLIGLLRSNWPYFILSIIVCISITKIYISTLSPQYLISSKIVTSLNDKRSDNGDQALLKGMGIMPRQNLIEEEIEILNNTAVNPELIKELNLNTSYFTNSRFNTTELYDKTAPFELRFNAFNEDTIRNGVIMVVKPLKDDNVELIGNGIHWKGKYGDTINFYFGRAVLIRNYNVVIDPKLKYKIKVTDYESAVEKFKYKFEVSVSGKMSNILILSFKETFPKRGELILSNIITNYIKNNIQQRNAIADSTMSFINERVKIMGNQLSSIETDIRDYKTQNELYDIGKQSDLWLSNSAQQDNSLKEKEMGLAVINMLIDQIKKHPNSIIPSSFLSDDPVFGAIDARIKSLQSERLTRLNSSTTRNPKIIDLDAQIAFERDNMLKCLESKKQELEFEVKDLKKTLIAMNSQLRDVPEKQRVFLDFSRRQGILQELYIFLLKNREQTAITKSSNVSSIRIINGVKSEKYPFFPNVNKMLYKSLMYSLFIPIIILVLINFLNNRVTSLTDITAITSVPVIGQIGHNPDKSNIVVADGNMSILSEQFRSMRTNLSYFLSNTESKTIMITSSMSEEGKTFIAANIASSLAISGKRVVIVELDLRRPKVTKNLGLTNTIGFSNYAIGNATLNEIIKPSELLQGFDVISSGPIPPNPAELILLPKMHELIADLRLLYDYIIIDTPPIGLVTDAQILSKFADITLYVIRNKHTYKEQINIVEKLDQEKRITKIGLVVNDINLDDLNGQGYGYNYNYNYTYDSSYNTENTFSRKSKKTKKA